jgi:hypothetical protein
MPYLSCPDCHFTVYNPSTVTAAPVQCPSCKVALAPASNFPSRRVDLPRLAESAESHRTMASKRDTQPRW